MTSRVYASFLLLTLSMATVWEILIYASFPTFIMAKGPFIAIFSTLVLYINHTPILYPDFIDVFGIPLSEKAVVYLGAAQVATSSGYSSAAPSVLGLIAGLAYCAEPFAFLRRVLVPEWISSLFGSTIGLLLNEEPATNRNVGQRRRQGRRITEAEEQAAAMEQFRMIAARQQQQQQQIRQPPPPPQPRVEPPPGAEPSEEARTPLWARGCGRERLVQVLRGCDNNVEVAANRLLAG